VAGAGHQGHGVGDEGGEEREHPRVRPQDLLGEGHQVVHAAGHLHRRNGGDDGHDDGDDVPGDARRGDRGAEQGEPHHPQAGSEPDADAPQAGAQEDRGKNDEQLQPHHRGAPLQR